MNKEYVGINGNAIVSDENGNLVHLKLTENIEEVLMQENIIEQLEKKILETKEELKKTLYEVKRDRRNLIFWGLFVLGLLIILPKIPMWEDLNFLSLLALLFSCLGLGSAGFATYYVFSYRKKAQKRLENVIPFLEKNLILENEKLQKLSPDKQIEKKGVSTAINEKEKLDLLKRKLQLYLFLKEELEKNSSEIQNQSFNHELYTEEEWMEVKGMLETEKIKEKVLSKSGR